MKRTEARSASSVKLIAFIIFCLFQLTSLKSQTFRAFSGDGSTFSAETKQFFLSDRNADKRRQANAVKLVDEFSTRFDLLTDDEQKAFMTLCNTALKANMRPFPTFENLLKVILNFFKDEYAARGYSDYIQCLNSIAENRKMRDFDLLLESTNRLFETGFLHESLSAKWNADGDFVFECVNGKPRFVFLETNLVCYANGDSTRIHETQGTFYPLTFFWQGQTGLVDFTRAGFDLSEMYILLDEYEINLRTSRYQADSVNFFNKIYFSRPLFGRMEERVLPNVKVGQASYPTFTSYDNSLKIDNIFENVDFEGPYMQVGSRVRCGEKNETATLKFRQSDNVILTVTAKSFLFGQNRISSPLAQVHIPIGDGEIVHTTCEIRYDDTRRELSILHPSTNAFKNPISNSYHNLDMHVEAIYWPIDSSFMDFRMLKIPNNKGVGIFESKQFYTSQDLQSVMERLDYNPLLILRKVSEKFNSRTLPISSVAENLKLGITQTKVMLLEMASKGFLLYDAETETVELQEKVFHFLHASAKRSDYDVIRIVSQRTDASNAILNLKTNDLQIFGIERIFLSLAQNVYVTPYDQTIVVKRNRDFAFEGEVRIGRFDFVASGCYFDYERFKISMDNVEALTFAVKQGQPDIYGNYQLRDIETIIEDLSGEIFIDKPTNKSGKEHYRQFPIFVSSKDSYARYDNPNIQNSIYSSDKFFYTIYPFRLENLNGIETDSLRFDGYLTSAGIFPDIHEKLRVMPDFSLGFTTLPDSAWPVYQGAGTFYDTLRLSNDGLIGSGRLEFMASTNLSNQFLFMPDSMNATIKIFNVKAQSIGPEFAETKAKTSKLHWQPYNNFFSVTNKTDGFSVFDDEILFYGELVLSDTGMIGEGKAVFKNKSEMNGEKFVFKDRNLFSDSIAFRIKSKDGKQNAIQSENYNVHIDFDKQKGYFANNDSGVFLNFPVTRYLCYMNELEWDIKENLVYLKNSQKSSYTNEQLDKMNLRELIAIGKDLPGSDFISLHPGQDSLTFNSPLAEYNLETHELKIQQVRIIYTADIAVQPTQGDIVVGKDAVIKPFENANILADVKHQYYDIYNATVTIQGRSRYTANGTYNYEDISGKIHPIRFERIAPDRNGITTGTAKIEAEDSFSLSPAFDFLGQITLKANDQLLQFSGKSKINYVCEEEDQRSWFSFNAPINPKHVEIPIAEPNSRDRSRREGIGFYMTNQGNLFPAFFMPIKPSDKVVMSKSGVLFYDTILKSYIVEPSDKSRETDRLVYNIVDCSLKSYGTPDFNLNLGRVIWDNFGTLYHNYRENTMLFDGIIGMKFFFDEKALKLFSESLEDADGSGAEQNTDKFVDYLYSKLSQREAERLEKEIEMYGAYRRLPSNMEQTILFSDVKMQWDEASRSFVSIGKLGIAAIGQNQINKYVNGTLQVIKSRRGDVINLYVEISRREWYFFSYSDGLMQVISSDPGFNEVITSLKPSKRKQKGGEGRGSYEFGLSTTRKGTDFLFKANAIRKSFDRSDSDDGNTAPRRPSRQDEDEDDD
ncbi:MAG: hypothetical protein LBH22_07815 [Bacteroidales bacterium]|jgi:hypothetical protein|nr:hypothetical protein [Bacteroidales bacterium]